MSTPKQLADTHRAYKHETLKRLGLTTSVEMAHLDRALRGEVVCNIGQIGSVEQRAMERAVRRGELVKWRGYWYPQSGHPTYGMGPLKTCYSTVNLWEESGS